MELVRRAVIDVGTNSIKLLVADVTGHDVQPVWEGSKQTRLGRGFYESHRLQPAAIATTAKAVAEFVAAARERQAASIRIIATSAARDAINALELTAAIETAAGLKVEIISGEQEADLAFQGVTSEPQLAQEPLLLLDVGGGSAEFIFGQGQHKFFRQSFPLGTVRLMERIPHSEPPKPEELAACHQWAKEFLEKEVRPRLETVLLERARLSGAAAEIEGRGSRAESRDGSRDAEERVPASLSWRGEVQLVGTGGTATILGCMEAELDKFDRQRLEATRLSLERLRWHVRRLWSLPLEERKQLVGLPENRADVILTGAVIYEAIMEQLGFAELRISTRGLRFAAMMAAKPGTSE